MLIIAGLKYFANNFEELKIKKLLTSSYREQRGDLFGERNQDSGFFFEYTGEFPRANQRDAVSYGLLSGDRQRKQDQCGGAKQSAQFHGEFPL